MNDDLDLDEVHDLIDSVDFSVSELKASDQEFASYTALAGLTTAFLGLYHGWIDYGSDEARQLGVPPKLVKSLLKPEVKIRRHDAIVLGNRFHSLLKELESELGSSEKSTVPSPPFSTPSENQKPASQQNVVEQVKASTWVSTPRVASIAIKISKVSTLLDDILYITVASNLPEQERALSPIERAQLIAVLETALQLLKAPLIERGLLETCKNWLVRAATRSAEKKTEETLGALTDKAAEELGDFISQLPWGGG